MTQQAAALFLVTSFHSVPAQGATDVYFLSEFVAPVVMGGGSVAQPERPTLAGCPVRSRPGNR